MRRRCFESLHISVKCIANGVCFGCFAALPAKFQNIFASFAVSNFWWFVILVTRSILPVLLLLLIHRNRWLGTSHISFFIVNSQNKKNKNHCTRNALTLWPRKQMPALNERPAKWCEWILYNNILRDAGNWKDVQRFIKKKQMGISTFNGNSKQQKRQSQYGKMRKKRTTKRKAQEPKCSFDFVY